MISCYDLICMAKSMATHLKPFAAGVFAAVTFSGAPFAEAAPGTTTGQAKAPAAKSAPASKNVHVVNFPTDRRVGTIIIKTGRGDSQRREAFPAKGRVVLRNNESAELDISYEGLRDPSFLLTIPHGAIPIIDAAKLEIGDKFVETVSKVPGMASLTLDDTDVDDNSMKIVADNAKTLSHMSVKSTLIGPKALQQIARMKTLISLTLAANRLDNNSIGYLSTLPTLNNLSLSRTGVSDDVVDQLKKLKALAILDLSENDKFTDKGVERLSELKNLILLKLVRTSVTYKCFPSLQKLPNLQELVLDTSQFSNVDLDKLKKMLPKCTITATKVSKIPLEMFAPLH